MTNHSYIPKPEHGADASVLAYLVTAAAVLLLMMIFGLLMRMEQAQLIDMGPMWFYQLMTLHGKTWFYFFFR